MGKYEEILSHSRWVLLFFGSEISSSSKNSSFCEEKSRERERSGRLFQLCFYSSEAPIIKTIKIRSFLARFIASLPKPNCLQCSYLFRQEEAFHDFKSTHIVKPKSEIVSSLFLVVKTEDEDLAKNEY